MSIGFGYMAQGAMSGAETLRQRRLKDEALDREAIALKRQNEWDDESRAETRTQWRRNAQTEADRLAELEYLRKRRAITDPQLDRTSDQVFASGELALGQQPINYKQQNELFGLDVEGIRHNRDRLTVIEGREDQSYLDSRDDRDWMLSRRGKDAAFTDYLRAFTKEENAHNVTRREFDEAYTDWTRANAKTDRYTLLSDAELDRAYLKWQRAEEVKDKGITDTREKTKFDQDQAEYQRKVDQHKYNLQTQIPAELQREVNELRTKGQIEAGKELINAYYRQNATRSTIKEAISTGTSPIQAYKDAESLLVGMGYPATEVRKTIKLLESEGFQDTMKAVMQGDLRKAEQVWNSTGDNRIQVGSLAWKDDAKTVLEWQEVGADGSLTDRSVVVSDQKDLWGITPYTPSETAQAGVSSAAAKHAYDIILEEAKQSGKLPKTVNDWVSHLSTMVRSMASEGDFGGMGVNTPYVVDFHSIGESLIRAGNGKITSSDAVAVIWDSYGHFWGSEVSDQERRTAFDAATKAANALLVQRGIGAEPQAEPTPMSAAGKSTLLREVQGFTGKYPDATFDDFLQAIAGSGVSESDLQSIGITRETYRGAIPVVQPKPDPVEVSPVSGSSRQSALTGNRVIPKPQPVVKGTASEIRRNAAR
jgi:hypothetical protein